MLRTFASQFVNERPRRGKQLNMGSDLRLDVGLDVNDLRLELNETCP